MSTDLWHELVKPGMTVIDMGANFGHYTMVASHLVGPGGVVHAFEPSQFARHELEGNIALLPDNNVTIHSEAVSDQCGTLALHAHDNMPGLQSLGGENLQGGNGGGTGGSEAHEEIINTVRLDDLFPAGGDTPVIGMIKSDIQGADFFAMRGAYDLLARDRPPVMMEFWPFGLRNILASTGRDVSETMVIIAEVMNFFADQGYCIFEIGNRAMKVRQIGLDEILRYAREQVDQPLSELDLFICMPDRLPDGLAPTGADE